MFTAHNKGKEPLIAQGTEKWIFLLSHKTLDYVCLLMVILQLFGYNIYMYIVYTLVSKLMHELCKIHPYNWLLHRKTTQLCLIRPLWFKYMIYLAIE